MYAVYASICAHIRAHMRVQRAVDERICAHGRAQLRVQQAKITRSRLVLGPAGCRPTAETHSAVGRASQNLDASIYAHMHVQQAAYARTCAHTYTCAYACAAGRREKKK